LFQSGVGPVKKLSESWFVEYPRDCVLCYFILCGGTGTDDGIGYITAVRTEYRKYHNSSDGDMTTVPPQWGPWLRMLVF
jgi:hypothetical protein